MKPPSLKKFYSPFLGFFLLFVLCFPGVVDASAIDTYPGWAPDSSTVIYPNTSFTLAWDSGDWWQQYNGGWSAWTATPARTGSAGFTPAVLGWGVGWHAFGVTIWDGSQWVYAYTPWVWVANPPAPTATFTITDTTAGSGASHNLSIPLGHTYTWNWNSTGGTSWSSSYTSNNPAVCGSGAWVANTANGSDLGTITPAMVGCVWTITYSVSGDGGSTSDTATATAINTPPPVINSFTASNTSLPYGGGLVTLTWSSSNTTSCTASNGWSGTKATSGSEQVSLSSTATYDLTCQ